MLVIFLNHCAKKPNVLSDILNCRKRESCIKNKVTFAGTIKERTERK